jgi:polyisoprenoid-binding protein YceI
MKKVTIIAAVFAGALMSFSVATSSIWTSDAGHSRLGFTVKHLGISDFNGSFDSYEVKMTGTKEDLSDAKIELSGDATSINTGNEMRDGHLKSADFFDVEKFPKFTFESTSIKKGKGKGEFTVTGNLTMHGVTKAVNLKATKGGVVTHPMTKKQVTAFKLTGSFKRSDFGIGSTTPEAIVGDVVNVISDLELVQE